MVSGSVAHECMSCGFTTNFLIIYVVIKITAGSNCCQL